MGKKRTTAPHPQALSAEVVLTPHSYMAMTRHFETNTNNAPQGDDVVVMCVSTKGADPALGGTGGRTWPAMMLTPCSIVRISDGEPWTLDLYSDGNRLTLDLESEPKVCERPGRGVMLGWAADNALLQAVEAPDDSTPERHGIKEQRLAMLEWQRKVATPMPLADARKALETRWAEQTKLRTKAVPHEPLRMMNSLTAAAAEHQPSITQQGKAKPKTDERDDDGQLHTTSWAVVVTVAGQSGLPLRVECSSDGTEAVQLAMQRLGSQLNTDTLQTLMALLSIADDRGGFTINLAELGRRRGWDRLDKHGRAKKLRDALELFERTEFTFTQGTQDAYFPLLVRTARVADRADPSVRGVRLYFNHDLWPVWHKDGHLVALDERLMTLNAKTEAWALRIGVYLQIWAARSFVTRQLDRPDSRMFITVGRLLDGAGIQYQKQLREQGSPWLRERFKAALMTLARFDPPLLLAEITEEGERATDDLVSVQIGEHVRRGQSAVSTKRLGKRDRNIAKRESAKRRGPQKGRA